MPNTTTHTGLVPAVVGRIRKLRDQGYSAREIVRLTGYEPANVRRVVCQESDEGCRFKAAAAKQAEQERKKEWNENVSAGSAARALLREGYSIELIRACYGEVI